MAEGVEASASGFDVFVSYTHADGDWVRTLAENLNDKGLHVFFDEWEIGPGDVIVHRINEALLTSRNGAVVVSPASMKAPWVAAEYAAMQVRAIEGKLRLIPVLYGDAEMPPLLATHLWVDFRGADGPEYERRVRELAAGLRGERPGPPTPGEGLKAPPGTGLRAEAPMRRTLRLGAAEVTLLDGTEEVGKHQPRGLDHSDEQRLWELERLRRQWPEDTLTRAETASGESLDARLQRALLDAGMALGRSALVGAAGAALRQSVQEAETLNVPLELALEIGDDRIADLPWEVVRLPAHDGEFDPPLALHPRVRVYRSLPSAGTTTAIQITGPLRVLVAIGSPESDNARGELLDYEAEMAAILDVVEQARSAGGAHVRILEAGTVAAIRQALEHERYHVLHVSCHAAPGWLVLEDDRGAPDLVDASRLVHEVLPAGRGVPLVVLTGCFTAFSVREREERAVALPGLARALLGHGVPAVLAMNAAVGDVYATQLLADMYLHLATTKRPDPLAALSDVRRQIEAERRAAEPSRRDSRPEWATPVLYQRGPRQPLFDHGDGNEEIVQAPEPTLTPGVVVRRVGEFVGRRREQRLLLRALRGEPAGVVIHGLGGVGKSTLAAQLVWDLAIDTALVVSVAGKTGVDQVLVEVGQRLAGHCIEQHLPEDHPYRELAQVVRNPQLEWEERLGYLGQVLLGRERMLLLLDNFEDNLEAVEGGGWRVRDPGLGSLLSSWLERPGRSRLLVTSRYPVELPEGQERRLGVQHLGPLTLAETRKLIWRLPGLDALGREEQQRAYADVGGHPRALEYLDALLRGGRARFADVAERMEQALSRRGITRPRSWMAGVGGDLDRALAEAVTLAVDDVLLGELVGRVEGIEGAVRLLQGASVYRLPVDEIGLWWQAGDEVEVPADPDREARRARLREAQVLAAREGSSLDLEELGLEPELEAQIRDDWRQATVPPLRVPAGFGEALGALEELGLVAPVAASGESGERGWAVHRWTAGALAMRSEAAELASAHRRAARYWRWRVRVWPQDRLQDVLALIEARYHLRAAGDLEEAVAVTDAVVEQLNTWGAWGWEERLCLETLGWLPAGSHSATNYKHQLGIVAQLRGDYDAALDWYRRSLAIFEELGDRSGMARSYQNLGIVAQLRADYDGALDWYRRSLAIAEELGDQAGMARSYHNLGIVAQDRGDYDGALDWYRRSLAIAEELGDRAGMTISYHQLGRVAQDRGDYDRALHWYRRALAIAEELGNRAGMASSYHQLGMVAQDRGDYDGALDWYRRSLAIKEELGDRAGMARSYHNLGIVAQLRGDYDGALDWYRRSLAILEELGDRAAMASSYHQLGMVAQNRGDYDGAFDWYRRSLAIAEELGNKSGMAGSYHQLGMVAQDRGDYDGALDWYRRSLAIAEELGDRAGMAGSYHQLGRVAQVRGDYDGAIDWYRRSLAIAEELGDQAGMARSYHQRGVVAQDRGDYDGALDWYRRSLAIKEELGNQSGMASSYHQLGMVAQDRGDYDGALDWFRRSLAIAEELGDRASIARTAGQIGALLTETGQVAEAIPHTLSALWMRMEMRLPDVRMDIRWLGRQRTSLGERRFWEVVSQRLDRANVDSLRQLLDGPEQ